MAATSTAEIVICGAGIAGIAAAHRLAVRERVSSLILIDEREPLSLTSSKGTEAYRNWWPGPCDSMVRFMNRSIDLLDELKQESGDAFELNRRGYVFLSSDLREGERLRANAQKISALGAGPLRDHASLASYDPTADWGADYVPSAGAIGTLFPFVTDRAQCMLHVRRAGFMNARKLGAWLLDRAVASGVRLIRDRVDDLEVAGGAFRAVRLMSGARIEGRACVVAVGPLLLSWAERLKLDVPILDERHGKVAFEDDAGVVPRSAPLMIWNDAADLAELGRFPPGVHFRPRGERTLLGIWTYDSAVEEPQFPPRFDARFAEIVISGLAQMIPGLSRYKSQAREALVDGGYYCKAPDNRPLIGPTAIEGVFLLGALSGFGVMGSQAAAELLAASILEHRAPPDYTTAFSPARFRDPAYRITLASLGSSSGQL